MATSPISPFYNELLRRIGQVRSKEQRFSLIGGFFLALVVSLTVVLIVLIMEQMLRPDTIGRAILFFLSLLTIAGSFGWLCLRPLLRMVGIMRSDDTLTVARRIGRYFPTIRDRLLDALQIYNARESLRSYYSSDLIDASFADVHEAIRDLDFRDAVSDRKLRKFGRYASLAAGVAIVSALLFPSLFTESSYRLFRFDRSFAATLPLRFEVSPGNADVVRGGTVPITVRAVGRTIPGVSIMTRNHGQSDFESVTTRSFSAGTFAVEMTNVKQSFEYYAAAGGVESERYRITVLDRPLIRSLRVTLTPPAYTRLPEKMLEENVGDIQAFAGTRIHMAVTASKEIAAAAVLFGDSSRLTMIVHGTDAGVRFILKRSSSYHFHLVDRDSLASPDPVQYAMSVIPDEYPAVEILHPARNIDLTGQMRLDLQARLTDDFGFSRLRLAYRLVQSRYEQPGAEYTFTEIPLLTQQPSGMLVRHLWDLDPLHLVPEDVVEYYLEVFDNDVVGGPKAAKSETFLVRLPSLEEVFSDVSGTQEQSLEAMQQAAKETAELKKDLDELTREMKKNRDKVDWQQQKKAEEILQRYESMTKKLDETSRTMDEMVKRMDDHNLLSQQTLDKYLELQKLIDELKTPELQEAMKKLQESMRQFTPEQMKQALEQMKFSEDRFRQSLERTIELLKRIHIEQKIDELVKRTEEILHRQEDLRQEAGKTKPDESGKREELARRQEDLEKDAASLEKETGTLKEKMEEFAKEMPLDEMNKAQSELQQRQLPRRMRQSTEQLRSGEMQQAQQHQQQTEEGLQEFLDDMKNIRQALQDQQMKQVVEGMRKQLENLVELSKRQESLKEETGSFDPNSQRFRGSAQQQHEMIGDLANVADALTGLAKKTFAVSPEMAKEIGNAIRQMTEAMQGLEARNPGSSSQKQHEAMGSLNRAAMAVQGGLNALMQGGQSGMGMSGLMNRLGQMVGQQGSVNEGTQQAMGSGNGQGITPEQAAEYGRLAGQQATLQKSLEQLSRETKDAGDFSKLLGDLDDVAKEMSEVQTDLAQGNVNPETIRKQERILSRLLDSQRSTRERDFEKRRRAEAGSTIPRSGPADIDLGSQEGKNRLREELLRVLAGKYSKDYEELIRKYFEKLESEEIPR